MSSHFLVLLFADLSFAAALAFCLVFLQSFLAWLCCVAIVKCSKIFLSLCNSLSLLLACLNEISRNYFRLHEGRVPLREELSMAVVDISHYSRSLPWKSIDDNPTCYTSFLRDF